MDNDAVDAKRYAEEVEKDQSARFLIMSCISEEIVHKFEDMKSAKSTWDALEKKYGIMSPARLCAISIKLGNTKCHSTKGIEKQLLMLCGHFASLENAEHGYFDK